MSDKDEKEIRNLLSALYYVGANARKYAEWIQNKTMIGRIVDSCELLEKFIKKQIDGGK